MSCPRIDARSRTRRPLRCALLVVCALPAMPAARAEIVPMYEVAVTVEGRVGDGAPWVKLRLDEGFLDLDLGHAVAATDQPTAAHLAASFLVDHDEAPIQQLLADQEPAEGTGALIEALMRLTDRALPTKSFLRDWDAASVAVQRGEGDCTEHAMVLAALARARGLPARVVIGTLLWVRDDGVGAFGHAWTEIHDGEIWRLADASQVLPQPADGEEQQAPPRVYYVPLGLMEVEGAGYGLPLFNLVARTHPKAIVVGWNRGQDP